MANAGGEASICEEGGAGLILPLFADEWQWPRSVRVILYLLGLGYLFCAIKVISDVFMNAIETITAKTKRKMNPATGQFVNVKVWNPTVANLTLMALGSSAPEILLSIIELLGDNMYSGELGPSTIVGSAAFNLFVIISVCVMAIPAGEVRKIKEVPVYCVTSTCSVFAYVWLIVILLGTSPHIVEIWEGLLTFIFFFLLITVAYLADRGYFGGKSPDDEEDENIAAPKVISADLTVEELARIESRVRAAHSAEGLTEMDIVKLIEEQAGQPETPKDNSAATANPRKVAPVDDEQVESPKLEDAKIEPPKEKAPELLPESFGFAYNVIGIVDSKRSATVRIKRFGDASTTKASVKYQTRPGSAKVEDFKHIEGVLAFEPAETEKEVIVEVVESIAFESQEEFYIDLFDGKADSTSGVPLATATVIIFGSEDAGSLRFEQTELTCFEGLEETVVNFNVMRKNGAAGKVTIAWTTEDHTAQADTHYCPASGTLEFEHGQMIASIPLTILPSGRFELTNMVRVIISNITGGAKFDPSTEGGAEKCIGYVEIKPDPELAERIQRIHSSLLVNWKNARASESSRSLWVEQIKDSFSLEDEGEDGEESGPIMTCLSKTANAVLFLPWKVLFALINPPVEFCDGWVCFISSLACIGGVTALVGDMAALLGCAMRIPDAITAITFVALGTSLPDTFASKTAAEQDPYADASVGNVTGSNSVNVFLGLGMPWTLGAFFWTFSGADDEWNRRWLDKDFIKGWEKGAFVVEAGGLAFSVGVFSACAFSCVTLLAIRRKAFGGELGGPRVPQLLSSIFLVFLWLVYVGMSTWYIMAGS
eukprot:TRINITY_DN78309_c0_g1_i1.p1 TRINITY_DN78309_c0_g1~~TRINITY_DN78309_c0_g1_i1.p1  ORF type:complete len:826 (-),score=159.09 TRINITY_DN78309_c0_g1_i1:104-2581(-)